MISIEHFVKEKVNSEHLVQLMCYVLIIIMSSVLITYFITTDITQLHYDAAGYFSRGSGIELYGPQTFADPVHTYGYPFFIAAVMRIGAIVVPQVNPVEFIVFVQFLLHTLGALIGVSIMEKLDSANKTTFLRKVICFAIIQLAPPLLGLTRDILTDGLSVFLFTVFAWILLTPSRFRPLLISTTLALAMVVRPFYAVYAVGLFSILITAHLASRLIAVQVGQKPFAFALPNPKTLILAALSILTPILLIVGLQFAFVYNYEQRIGLVGALSDEVQRSQLKQSGVYYKVETYAGSIDRFPQFHYVFSRAVQAINNDDLSFMQFILKYPLDALYVFTIKTVALFQNFEWSTYRTTLNNDVNVVFLYGAVFFSFLVCTNYALLRNVQFSLLKLVNLPPKSVIIVLMIDLHVFFYSILTIPESRFVAPVLPVLTSFSIHAFSRIIHDRRSLLAILFLSFTLYIITYQILIASFS